MAVLKSGVCNFYTAACTGDGGAPAVEGDSRLGRLAPVTSRTPWRPVRWAATCRSRWRSTDGGSRGLVDGVEPCVRICARLDRLKDARTLAEEPEKRPETFRNARLSLLPSSSSFSFFPPFGRVVRPTSEGMGCLPRCTLTLHPIGLLSADFFPWH